MRSNVYLGETMSDQQEKPPASRSVSPGDTSQQGGREPMERLYTVTKSVTERLRSRRQVLSTAAKVGVGSITLSAAGSHTAAGGGSESERSATIDWEAVGQAIGKELEPAEGGIHEVEFLRTDLNVTAEGVPLEPGMEIAMEAMFMPVGDGRAMMAGELTLTEDELQPAISTFEQGGIEISALHKHLLGESPRLWWLHMESYGDPVQMAETVRSAIEMTRTPLEETEEASESASREVALDTECLNRIIGLEGEAEGGVYTFSVPRTNTIKDTKIGMELPPPMETSSKLFFQPTDSGNAAINGDLVMTREEIDRVIRTLRMNEIEVVSLHNHLTNEQPRLFYMHFWATGDAIELARALRAALNKTNSK